MEPAALPSSPEMNAPSSLMGYRRLLQAKLHLATIPAVLASSRACTTIRDVRYVRSSDATLKTVGSGVAVYVTGRQAIHVLNPTAHLLFDYLAEPASLDELVLALETLTGGKTKSLRGDLEAALDQFLAHGIIEACDS